MIKLALDAGHGGRNIGTRAGGICEKDENLKLVLELAHTLPWDRVEPTMIRQGDEYMGFNTRALKSVDCDWLMSIHVNASRNRRQRGAEVFVLPGCEDELFVGNRVLAAMPPELRTMKVIEAVDPHPNEAGDWEEAPINVLQHHACKKILVEVCYASYPRDLAVLQSGWGRMAIVTALRAGVSAMLHP